MNKMNLLKKVKDLITEQAGDITDKIILFGSRSREDSTDDSDYDILIILNSNADWRLEWKIYDICYDLSLEHDILIDAKILSASDMETIKGKQPYIQEALSGGVCL
jgi:predicted nucleotidyltransferase